MLSVENQNKRLTTPVDCRPGAIYTPIQVDTREAQEMEGWGSKVGLGRPGEPSEVATSFVFLASADSSLYCKCSDQAR